MIINNHKFYTTRDLKQEKFKIMGQIFAPISNACKTLPFESASIQVEHKAALTTFPLLTLC